VTVLADGGGEGDRLEMRLEEMEVPEEEEGLKGEEGEVFCPSASHACVYTIFSSVSSSFI
jgi:hypothetical protein